MPSVPVYVEAGKKRVFAVALEWPGWCRAGRSQAGALAALIAYGPRYRGAVEGAARGFRVPPDATGFEIVEELAGDASTDFGAPGAVPAADSRPFPRAKQQRFEAILAACWRTFDAAADAAEGKTLRSGPRGGGRDVAGIRAHVLDADRSYLSKLGGFVAEHPDRRAFTAELRAAFVGALHGRARGEIPDHGPRGGVRWPAPYAVRRSAWHALDHAWEIQDRTIDA